MGCVGSFHKSKYSKISPCTSADFEKLGIFEADIQQKSKVEAEGINYYIIVSRESHHQDNFDI